MQTINIQPTEKRAEGSGTSLDVQSIFLTLQGEGPFTGHRAVFVRLAGCNLQCPSCDTDYTSNRQTMTIEVILSAIQAAHSHVRSFHIRTLPLVVITGGEPMRQNLGPLLLSLKHFGFRVQVETNGTYPITAQEAFHEWRSVTIVCSPKTGKVHPTIQALANCFKYVMSHDSVNPVDGLPMRALNHTASPQVSRPDNRQLPIYLQPMDAKDAITNRKNQEAVLESCLKFGYMLQLQTHKLLDIE